MNGQTLAQDLFGLGQLLDLAQFFGERKKEPALRIGFDPEPQLFDFGIARWLRHS